jgi:hypothetical protein
LKKIFILLSLFVSFVFAENSKSIWVRTAPVDYSSMTIVDTSATTTTILNIKKVKGKNVYVSFTNAFTEFHSRNLATIKEYITKNKYDGVCNLKISFNVTDKGYYFLSTYDAYKYK